MTEEVKKVSQERFLIVGVNFTPMGKSYHFDATHIPDIQQKDKVIVQTSRGWQMGEVTVVLPDQIVEGERHKPVERKATPRDLLLAQTWKLKEADVFADCQKLNQDRRFRLIKFVGAEYSFDGNNLAILIASEVEDKLNLKPLRQVLSRMYPDTTIEIRQVGPRDVAKMISGLGACGLEKRCCSRFLTDFCSISIRMAKEQDISLTPAEITGMCGRLRCCLIYEYDQYKDARQEMPKKNNRVMTPQGEGRVVSIMAMKGTLIVDIPEVGRREFAKEDIKPIDAAPQQQKNLPLKNKKKTP